MNDLYKTLIYDNQVSLSVMDTTELVNKAIQIHKLNAQAAKTLGGMLTCGVFMAGCLKSDRGAVSITVKAEENVGTVSVSGDINLHMRGYIDGTLEGKLKGGSMTVVKEDGFFRPFVGTTELVSDDVSLNFMQYFDRSEQVPTAVCIGVDIEGDVCTAAGGVVMQLLPGTSDMNRDLAEEKMQNFLQPEKLIAKMGAKGIMENYFGGLTTKENVYLTHPDYICNCSRQKISAILLTMGKSELYNILEEQGKISVHCHYCNTDYLFDKEDIDRLTNG